MGIFYLCAKHVALKGKSIRLVDLESIILFKKVSLYYKKFPNFHNDSMKSKLLLNTNSKSVRINKLCTDFISNLLKIRKDSIS